ncbi:hypothetical protein DGG96_14600 [Legionella qingyii]|uniref:Uncharacterized protein n=1 Tax=Legionella qingyii TaxID=2184757 RepID=A0A317TZD9_9GAMM|nr:hypothetical protein DGG96_14600 [Legionella qingyii]
MFAVEHDVVGAKVFWLSRFHFQGVILLNRVIQDLRHLFVFGRTQQTSMNHSKKEQRKQVIGFGGFVNNGMLVTIGSFY